MKFSNLIAATLAIATPAVYGLCGQECDPSKVPSSPLKANITQIAFVDSQNPSIKYEMGGQISIISDCKFRVENFYLFPGTMSAQWYGNKKGNAEGIALSKAGAVSAIDPNQPQTLEFDVNEANTFCKASLLNDVDRIQLLDSNFQLLGYADVGSNPQDQSGPKKQNATSDAKTAKWTFGLATLSAVAAYLLA